MNNSGMVGGLTVSHFDCEATFLRAGPWSSLSSVSEES